MRYFFLFCFVTEVPHKCVSTGSQMEAMSIPFYICQPREDGKARPESILFTSTHRETEYNTQSLWHAITKTLSGSTRFITVLASLSV